MLSKGSGHDLPPLRVLALCSMLSPLAPVPGQSPSLLWLGVSGAAGRQPPASCEQNTIPEVFHGKIKKKFKKIRGEGDRVALLFDIPMKPLWGSILTSLCEAAAGSPGPDPHHRLPPPPPQCGHGQAQQGARRCRRDLGFFHVVTQPGQPGAAERSYKLRVVDFSC